MTIGYILGSFIHTCTPRLTESRWVEVSEKKNKPAEFLMEAKSLCDCGVVLRSYFTPDQLGFGPDLEAARQCA